MIYQKVSISVDPMTRITAFVLLHEVPYLRALWSDQAITQYCKFKITGRAYAPCKDEINRLEYIYGPELASYVLSKKPLRITITMRFLTWLAAKFQRSRIRYPREARFWAAGRQPAKPEDFDSGLKDAIETALENYKNGLWWDGSAL